MAFFGVDYYFLYKILSKNMFILHFWNENGVQSGAKRNWATQNGTLH
jgi:hypothetical protein